MSKKVLIVASNYGLWAEELQGPWDALTGAGHDVTLATYLGKKPLPMVFSEDPDFVDPVQNVRVNTPEVVARVKELVGSGAWDNPIKVADAKIDDYDVLVLVGGPGAPLDITGNPAIHRMIEKAFADGKLIGAMCYAIGALVWARVPDGKTKFGNSVLYGKTVVAHPPEWDFTGDLPYPLDGPTEDNPGTNLMTPGFVYPLSYIVHDAVGPDGKVLSDPTTSRDTPAVIYDHPFVTGLSVESSSAFGKKLAEVLARM
jgi:putative intracellular protease/amidase